jgi:hypothetical protein
MTDVMTLRKAAAAAAVLGACAALAFGAAGAIGIARADAAPADEAPLDLVAFQQPAPPPARPGGPGDPGGPRRSMMARRLDNLRDALRLTPQQQSSWDRFTTTLREQGARFAERVREQRNQGLLPKALDRLERAQRLNREGQAYLQTVIEATRTFYDGLTTEQKQTFDARFTLRPPFRRR